MCAQQCTGWGRRTPWTAHQSITGHAHPSPTHSHIDAVPPEPGEPPPPPAGPPRPFCIDLSPTSAYEAWIHINVQLCKSPPVINDFSLQHGRPRLTSASHQPPENPPKKDSRSSFEIVHTNGLRRVMSLLLVICCWIRWIEKPSPQSGSKVHDIEPGLAGALLGHSQNIATSPLTRACPHSDTFTILVCARVCVYLCVYQYLYMTQNWNFPPFNMTLEYHLSSCKLLLFSFLYLTGKH